MKTSKLFFAAFLILVSTSVFAQDSETDSHQLTINIPDVALLDIESALSNDITLEAAGPTEAGEKLNFDETNTDLWINYSSIVGTDHTRKVTVQITDGDVPAGLDLTVLAGAYSGSGKGTTGTPAASAINLNNKLAADIISGIGSCYTGDGASNGHQLTYQVKESTDASAYSNLNFDNSATLTITYTLTDE